MQPEDNENGGRGGFTEQKTMTKKGKSSKICQCGGKKRWASKTCLKCMGDPRKLDEYSKLIEEEFLKNLSTPMRTLARNLSVKKEFNPLTYTQILQRIRRFKRGYAEQNMKQLITQRDFSVVPAVLNIPHAEAEQLWQDQEVRSERYLKTHMEGDMASVVFDQEQPVALCFIADNHIGNEGTTHKRMREDAELINATPGMYAVLGGDSWDNHIKHLSAIINAKSAPSDQVKMFVFYMGLFWKKIVAVISGNHEWWTKQVSGVDVVKMLAERERIFYSPHGVKLTVKLGGQEYKIYIRHKTRYNSSFNPTHTIKQLYRMGDWAFDIGFRGDEHEADIEAFKAHGQMRWAIRGGSYQVYSEFGEQHGYPKALALCPTVILYPNERRIDCYEDLHKAIVPLRAAREEFQKK